MRAKLSASFLTLDYDHGPFRLGQQLGQAVWHHRTPLTLHSQSPPGFGRRCLKSFGS